MGLRRSAGRGNDPAGDLAEAEATSADGRGCAGDRGLVAVVKERPRRSVVELHGGGAVVAQLQKAAELASTRAADGAGREQVAGAHRRAVDGEVREHLRG